jgi:hypothetical protein
MHEDEERKVPFPPSFFVLTCFGEIGRYALIDKREAF